MLHLQTDDIDAKAQQIGRCLQGPLAGRGNGKIDRITDQSAVQILRTRSGEDLFSGGEQPCEDLAGRRSLLLHDFLITEAFDQQMMIDAHGLCGQLPA